jgi:hypothetical protein
MSSYRWRRRAVALLASVTAGPLLALAPGPASAQELRFADPRHDVVGLDVADPESGLRAEPGHANGDITSAFIHYRAGRLVVRVDFARLVRQRDTVLEYTGLIRTSRHRTWAFDVVTSPRRYAGHDTLVSDRGAATCEIGHRLAWREDFARVVVPLSCLGDPRWVRLSFGTISYTFDPAALASGELTPGSLVAHVDAAASESRDSLGGFTPRVHGHR